MSLGGEGFAPTKRWQIVLLHTTTAMIQRYQEFSQTSFVRLHK